MNEKRFRSGFTKYDEFSDEIIDELTGKHYFDSTKDDYVFSEEIVDLLNELNNENEQLKFENENLKITIDARDTLIEVCEKKFRELGFIITVDDDGYVIE